MREILFRGKRVENGEWITGFLVSEKHIGDWVIANPIAPETVGQYTGLTDKNGTKIFEGDICHIVDGNIDEEDGVFIVEWDKDYAMFILNGCYLIDFDNVYDYHIEVIGNIHDNPELLGGGGDG